MDELDEMTFWRLSESLNIFQAAALAVGVSPTRIDPVRIHLGTEYYRADPSHLDGHFQATLVALKDAIKRKSLKATICHKAARSVDNVGGFCEGWVTGFDKVSFEIVDFERDIDWQQTSFDTEELRRWLLTRGVTNGYFFRDIEKNQAGYLNRENSNYSLKLAAAIHAWEAITSDPNHLRGKSPKGALSKWLTENAVTYGLIKEDGSPNATGIEEAAKVANWKPEGGANKTPNE